MHTRLFSPIFRTLALLILLVVLVSPWPAFSAPEAASTALDPDAIDTYLQSQMQRQGLKGISLAVTQGDQILYLQGYGTAGGGRAMTAQTPMYIGSQSKSFTALAIAQLAEAGKIDLNAPVQTYIPWFRVADESASAKITVRHLVYHLSGLSEAGYTDVLADDASLEQAIRSLASAKLTAPVGTQFQYFNMGYAVLMQVIENVSGKSYADYLQQKIFTPLQMAHTYTDPIVARANGLSQGYSRFFGFAVPASQPHRAYELGGGYIISTAEDLAHFAIAMNNQGMYQGAHLLSPEWMRKLFLPYQGYAMGWFIAPGHIYHGGANETFKTFVDLYPSSDKGIVLLINQGYMLDHYISAPQVFSGLESLVVQGKALSDSQGISVKWLGWGLLALVLLLVLIHSRNIYNLRNWVARARSWPAAKIAWDVALNFIVPTLILVVVFSQVKDFFGYRFNLTYQMRVMFVTLTDISILIVVGSLPDYFQGFVKLFWILSGKTRKT